MCCPAYGWVSLQVRSRSGLVILYTNGSTCSRQQLREMGENGPYSFEELIARRGSLWTFDGEAIVSSLAQARANGRASLPVYSRQISDPVPDGVQLLETHKLVLVEGNYLLNWDDPLWGRLRSVLDERWFISCENIEQQRGRLIRRHLETWTREKEAMWGVGEEGAAKKADANDVLNAQFVAGHQKFADRVIISK